MSIFCQNRKVLRASRLSSLLAVLLIFSVFHCQLCLSDVFDDPVIIDGLYYYSIFISSNEANVTDGPSHVGKMCFPSFASAQYGKESVVFNDMCKGGSSIRIVNVSGIFTLTGSLTERGFVDGLPDVARFQGHDEGSALLNGLSVIQNNIFIADTQNNAVRLISPDDRVQTLLDSDSKYDDRGIYLPRHVVPCLESSSYSSIIISDYGNKRLLLATLTVPKASVITLLAQDVQPDQLFITKDNKLLYYSLGSTSNKLRVMNLVTRTMWNIGNSSCLGYKNSLALSIDEKELLYYGDVSNKFGVYSISTETTPEVAPTLCPKLKFSWPTEFGKFYNLVVRDDTSWWVLTRTSLFLVSTTPLSPSSSSSSSSGGSKHGDRNRAVAAFRSDALPLKDSCLMSQFFYWVRKDVTVAYKTDDYLTQFEPLDDPRMLIPGSLNVSGWCSKISASKSKDGTITFLKFWGPPTLSPEDTQSALTNSDWAYTTKFLNDLGAEELPFCFIYCGNECENTSFTSQMCVGYKSSSCDGVCKGMIASTAVMGACVVALFALMILSPSNILTALTMIPIL